MNVSHMLERISGSTSIIDKQKVDLIFEGEKKWTYKQLDEISNQYAHTLQKLGVQKGDRVGILLYNSLEYWALYFAIAKLGSIAVRLNFRLSSEELKFIINDSGTKVLCFHSELKNSLKPIKDKVPVKEYISLESNGIDRPDWALDWQIFERGDVSFNASSDVDITDPVMLMYTSGTTGRPKGALWSHSNTLWFCSMQIMKWGISNRTIAMTTGPLYHVGAMEDFALPTILAGGTVITMKSGDFSIEHALSIAEKEKATDLMLFPFMIYELLHNTSEKTFPLNSIKTIYSGGDPVRPWAIEQLQKRYPQIGLVQVYGLTEGTPIGTSLDGIDAKIKGHTVGKPLPMVEVKVVNQEREELPAGEVGEICIKSPVVCKGYWNRPEANAETFIDGWCYTGDLGKVDEDGFLIVAGRKKDMIRSGGENIYAAEIENVLMHHQDIVDVAVIGIPDPKYIETVCAIIIKKEESDLTEHEVVSHCQKQLASYKKPRKVYFVEEIPRTPSGKIQKYKLRETFNQRV
ncbi:AMP-binding protein [Mesobacillus maritimus]|uniref:class I adenylate-forming enzyme family protein n=1 Tax=Mesobacillus maritimus TaxID=1643336 RepID=UPI00203E8082|nr:AMP-binding protein [Mesobacillus maritimus]MCM3585927.1 AMP-binding protein [Mesobacillus maritimus]